MKRALSLLVAGGFGTAYAAYLSTDDGQRWIDEHTTLGVVLGVGTVLGALRLGLDRTSWRMLGAAFAAAGSPMVIRKLLK